MSIIDTFETPSVSPNTSPSLQLSSNQYSLFSHKLSRPSLYGFITYAYIPI